VKIELPINALPANLLQVFVCLLAAFSMAQAGFLGGGGGGSALSSGWSSGGWAPQGGWAQSSW